MKNKKLFITLIVIILSIITISLCLIIFLLSPVSKNSEEKKIIIPSGSSFSDIALILKDENLIKNEKFFKLYLKFKKVNNIYAASYYLRPNMNIEAIVNTLLEGGQNENEIEITFREGLNYRNIATIIANNTNNTYNDVLNVLKDEDYINSLIEEYWFLTNDIKQGGIYYSLEGYLFPNTYRFNSKDVTVKEVFKIMLDQTEKVLGNYKETITNSKYSVHKLITLASITQSEGYNEDDFKNIASVFYNRMNSGMSLGSCVTSYYGAKKEMTEELLMKEINGKNPYNTRGTYAVSFPIGPISNPGVKAIEAVVSPITTKYYFFVSDKNHTLYFTKTNSEHEAKISDLQRKGLWLEW